MAKAKHQANLRGAAGVARGFSGSAGHGGSGQDILIVCAAGRNHPAPWLDRCGWLDCLCCPGAEYILNA